MTSARVLLPREPQMRVVAALKALRAARDISPDELAHAAGMARATYFKRLNDGQFTIGEVIALADYLDVPVQDLVDGKLSVPEVRPNLALVNGRGLDPVPRTPLVGFAPTHPAITRNQSFTRS